MSKNTWIPMTTETPAEFNVVDTCIMDHSGCYAQTKAYRVGKIWYKLDWKYIPALYYLPTHWRK